MKTTSLVNPLLLGGLFFLGACFEEPDPQALTSTEESEASASQEQKAVVYLQRYGYLEKGKVGAAQLKEALALYQQINKLPDDGTLSSETLALMAKPRCAHPDHQLVAKHRRGDLSANFVPSPFAWASPETLKYLHFNYTTDLSSTDVDSVLSSAVGQWISANPRLGISRVTTGAYDIAVAFLPQTHQHGGTSVDFGPSDLAHTFFPGIGLGGDLHFNDTFTWTTNGTGTDLLATALHEIGHSLGLDHSSNPNAVMWPQITGLTSLSSDDIAGIRTIYPPVATTITNTNNACFGANTLTWGNVAGATRYDLYRSTSSGFTSPVLVESDGDTSAEVNVPTGGWYLRVKACNAEVCSDYSNQVKATYYNGCL